MFNKIDYFAPYFNDTKALREAYQTLYPEYTYDQISPLLIGALSVFVPTEKFDELVRQTMSEATAKLNNNN